jgi:folate-binding protein YgfZ
MTWSDELRAQYHEATTNSVLLSLPHWTTVRMTGADRVAFLHNMCTNDIKGLQFGHQCEAFLTDVKGKIVGYVLVFALPEELLLVAAPGQAERIMGNLDRYIIREDVQLADISPRFGWAVGVGPAAAQMQGRITATGAARWGDDPPLVMVSCSQIWCGGSWIGGDCHRDAHTSSSSDNQRLWHALRIESGWPLFGVDFGGSNLPQEVGRDAQAISFRKGCYLGQETVARIDALGHVNKRLCTVRLAGEVAAGDELSDGGEAVGRVTSASYSPRFDAWLALAIVRRGHNEPGARLACHNQFAEVIRTPAVVAGDAVGG